MAILEIRKFGDPVLRKRSKPVENITERTSALIDDMIQTMYAAPGIGLAAPQVGVLERIIVVDVEEDLIVLINPELIESEGEVTLEEGCLSFPEIEVEICRPQRIVVKGLNQDGEEVTIEAYDIKARALAHESEHLDGTMIIDKVGQAMRETIEKKMRRWHRKNREDKEARVRA